MTALPDDLVTKLEQDASNIDSVLEEVKNNSGLANEFINQVMGSLTFFGKSLAVWEDEMVVPIPEGRHAPEDIRALYVDLANKIQQANHWYCLANSSSVISNSGVEIKQAELVTGLMSYYVSQNAKAPPQTVLERMAANYVKKLQNLATVTKIIRDFWKEKLTTLKEVRSILDSLSVSYATEMKYQNLE